MPKDPQWKEDYEDAVQKLRAAGFRITNPRVALLKVLLDQELPCRIEDLHQQIGPQHCDLATLYRCLATFQELGIVRRCFLNDGTSLFEIVSPNREHNHHVICKICHKVETFDVCVAEGLEPLVRKLGYRDISHVLEFFGICEDCQDEGAQPASSASSKSDSKK
ncbi:MAG: transcriptional repressor [Opitutales bacterium]|nr:transcriptional repressor [Opitutales bacterium]MCH8540470.1 transcriptional repressor [Opitutales bacterium]